MKKMTIISLVIAASLLVGCSGKPPYSKEQAMVKHGYESIKDKLLDPESMIVYDCYSWTSKSEEQSMENATARVNSTETELPDDLLAVYYHIGARNKMGGMSEAQYIYLYDPETGEYKSSGEKDEVDEAVDAYVGGDKSVYLDRDVQGEFLNVEFWLIMGWPERAVDYKDFIKSEDFQKVDVKKILG